MLKVVGKKREIRKLQKAHKARVERQRELLEELRKTKPQEGLRYREVMSVQSVPEI